MAHSNVSARLRNVDASRDTLKSSLTRCTTTQAFVAARSAEIFQVRACSHITKRESVSRASSKTTRQKERHLRCLCLSTEDDGWRKWCKRCRKAWQRATVNWITILFLERSKLISIVRALASKLTNIFSTSLWLYAEQRAHAHTHTPRISG